MSGQIELLSPQSPTVAVAIPTEEDFYASASQEDRIREVFELPAALPLPRVTVQNLGKYHAFLNAQLCFPFRAMYADSRPPVTCLIRHISVVRLLSVGGPVSRGIKCRVEDVPDAVEVPLMEIGVREDHPNAQLVDDFAYWFFNYL
jgi:hypothetical protein